MVRKGLAAPIGCPSLRVSLQGWRKLGEGLYHPKQAMHAGQMQLAFTQQFMRWFQRSLQA